MPQDIFDQQFGGAGTPPNGTQKKSEGLMDIFFFKRTWIGKTVFVLTILLAVLFLICAIRYKNFFMGIGTLAFVLAAVFIAAVATSEKKVADATGVPVVAALIAAVVLGIGLFGVLPGIKNDLYTMSLGISGEQLLAETGRQGTKYAVYDDEAKVFVTGILPAEKQASAAGEIGSVIVLYTTGTKTGTYNNGDEAWEYRINVVLKDLYTGETLGTETLYGGDAPKTVSTSVLHFGGSRHYGSKPSTDNIRSACLRLLEKQE